MSIVEQWPELLHDVVCELDFPITFYCSSSYDTNQWQEKYIMRTVKTFGELMSAIKEFDKFPPSNLLNNTNFYATKDNILPFWESPENKNGGRWSFIIYRSEDKFIDYCLSYVDIVIFSLVCAMSSSRNQLIVKSFTNIIFTIKPKYFKLSVWVNDKDNIEQSNAVGDEIVRVLQNAPKFPDITVPVNLDLQSHNNEKIIKHIDIIYD